MNDPSFFGHLFDLAKHVSPYVDGQITPLSDANLADKLIHKEIPSSDTLRELDENLKNEHPEAGAAYWLTRTWKLLC
ncbi:siderophore ferric iron reductase, partial [Arcobacter sp. FW59]